MRLSAIRVGWLESMMWWSLLWLLWCCLNLMTLLSGIHWILSCNIAHYTMYTHSHNWSIVRSIGCMSRNSQPPAYISHSSICKWRGTVSRYHYWSRGYILFLPRRTCCLFWGYISLSQEYRRCCIGDMLHCPRGPGSWGDLRHKGYSLSESNQKCIGCKCIGHWRLGRNQVTSRRFQCWRGGIQTHIESKSCWCHRRYSWEPISRRFY